MKEESHIDGDEERYFVLGKHEPPGTKETFELMEVSIASEERAPVVESQSQTQREGKVGSRNKEEWERERNQARAGLPGEESKRLRPCEKHTAWGSSVLKCS